jgi:hypothetical protein
VNSMPLMRRSVGQYVGSYAGTRQRPSRSGEVLHFGYKERKYLCLARSDRCLYHLPWRRITARDKKVYARAAERPFRSEVWDKHFTAQGREVVLGFTPCGATHTGDCTGSTPPPWRRPPSYDQ